MDKLDEIPGIGPRSAQELVAEIGVITTVSPTAAHPVSRATFAPIDKQSAGRAKTASTGKGNLTASALDEIVAGRARTMIRRLDRSHRQRHPEPPRPSAKSSPPAPAP